MRVASQRGGMLRPSAVPTLFVVLSLVLPMVGLAPPQAGAAAAAPVAPVSPGIGLMFVENVGQSDSAVRFQVRTGSAIIWLAEDSIWITSLQQPEIEASPAQWVDPRGDIGSVPMIMSHAKLSFPAANPRCQLEGFDRLDVRLNYFSGGDPAHWSAGVPVWGGVRYVSLYPGYDLEITGYGGQWSWRLVASQPAQPAPAGRQPDVRLHVEGADDVVLRGDSLRLVTAAGELALPLLDISGHTADPGQEAGSRVERLALGGSTFEVTSPFAQAPVSQSALPADSPVSLLYSTFLGASSNDEVRAIAVDSSGAAYVTGWTASPDFPTTPGMDDSLGGEVDAFVAKLSPDGSSLVFSTYLGGTYQIGSQFIAETGHAIAVDGNGAVYVTGYTWSSDFPVTPGAFDTTHNLPSGDPSCDPYQCRSDVFITKLDGSGMILYSTYLGGSTLQPYKPSGGQDVGEGIAVDGQGMIYVTGWVDSTDFPTTAGAYKREYSNPDWGLSDDAFIAKLNPAGNGTADLLYSTYLGGAGTEHGNDIAVDQSGAVHVAGYCSYSGIFDFPTTPGAYDPGPMTVGGDSDAFVLKLNPAGNGTADLLYSTLLGQDRVVGRDGSDWGYSIALDSAGYVYVAGQTDSRDFPTTSGAFDQVCGTDGTCDFIPGFGSPGDAFVAKLSLAGGGAADLLYSTYLGGDYLEGWDRVDIAVDVEGDIYVTGDTWSDEGFPTTPGAYDTTFNGFIDVFVTRLHPAAGGAADLVYSTFFGGTDAEGGWGIAVGDSGEVYVVGDTQSPGFPTTPGAYDTTFGGGNCSGYNCADGLVLKVQAVGPSTPDVDAWVHAPPLIGAAPTSTAAVTIAYGNDGGTTATAVLLTATLEVSLAYVGDTSGISPTVSGNTIVWNLPDLPYLDVTQFQLLVGVPSAALSTRYPITLTLVSAGPEADAGDNVAVVEIMVSHQIFLPLVARRVQSP